MGKISVETCEIEGLKVITPTVFGDARGYFVETYNKNDYLKDFEKHFWVITFFSESEEGYSALNWYCKDAKADWGLLSFEQVIDDDYTPTGSDLFDDFWIKSW